eukprot:gnl/Dysnectes_brevis/1697_a1929_3121.p1 GENE.gnl/Dysnectes_brevis/1697_a1929_3121~~gnl/Dysnectes_brevis/1697_a1929_3121.p1  ORF type:complete len:136 (+),score=9.71 gnl/Dysnectes_brevis/1697_a1929_3121:104-511(+)
MDFHNLKAIIDLFYKIKKPYILAFILVSFFFITSGIIFNILNDVPPYGQERDSKGNIVNVHIVKRMGAQYSTEGYISGFLFTIGGLLVLLVGSSIGKPVKGRSHIFMAVVSVAVVFVGYLIASRFRVKMPSYLKR